MCNWHLELWGPSGDAEVELGQASAPGPGFPAVLPGLRTLTEQARHHAQANLRPLADYRIYTADCSGPDGDSYDPARACDGCGETGVVREDGYGTEPCEACGHQHRTPRPMVRYRPEDFA